MSDPTGSWIMHEGIWRGQHNSDILQAQPPDPGTVAVMPSYVASGVKSAAQGNIVVSFPPEALTGMLALLEIETANQALPAVPTGWNAHSTDNNGTGTAGATG